MAFVRRHRTIVTKDRPSDCVKREWFSNLGTLGRQGGPHRDEGKGGET